MLDRLICSHPDKGVFVKSHRHDFIFLQIEEHKSFAAQWAVVCLLAVNSWAPNCIITTATNTEHPSMSWMWTDRAEPKPGERLPPLKWRAEPLSALLGPWFHPSHTWKASAPHMRAECQRSFSLKHQNFMWYKLKIYHLQQSSNEIPAEPKALIFSCALFSVDILPMYNRIYNVCRGVRGGILFKSFREDYSLRTAPASSFKSMWSVWLKVLLGKSNSIDQKLEVQVKGACLFEVYPAGFWFISSK